MSWNMPCNMSLNLIYWKKYFKRQGHRKFVPSPPLGGGFDKNSGRCETLSTVRHVRLHVDFLSMKSSLGLWDFTFMCEVNLDGLPPLQPMRALRMQWSWAFNLVCEVALRATSHTGLGAPHHYTANIVIGGKGRAGPSSLHTTLEGPTEYVNARWM